MYCCKCAGLLACCSCCVIHHCRNCGWSSNFPANKMEILSACMRKLTKHLEMACGEKMEETTIWDEISQSRVCPVSCSILHKLFRELMGISFCDSGVREIRKNTTEKFSLKELSEMEGNAVLSPAPWEQHTRCNPAWLFHGHTASMPGFRAVRGACGWNERCGWQTKESLTLSLRFKWMVTYMHTQHPYGTNSIERGMSKTISQQTSKWRPCFLHSSAQARWILIHISWKEKCWGGKCHILHCC